MKYPTAPGTTPLLAACCALSLLSAAAAPAADRQTLGGHVPPVVAALPAAGRVAATDRLQLGIHLQLRNQDAMQKLLHDQYDRKSTNFHQFLTPQQFNDLFGPSAEDYQAVIAFAQSNNLRVIRQVPGRNLINVEAAAADIESAFHLKLQYYQHPLENRVFRSPDTEPSLDLKVSITAIGGLTDFYKPRSRHHVIPDSALNPAAMPKAGSYNYSGGGTLYMGSDFRHAFVPGVSLNGAGQTVGLFELDGYTPADITAYEDTAGLAHVTVKQVLLPGIVNDPDNGDIEVPLDVQMVISMAPAVSQVTMYDGSSGDPDSILTEMADPTQGEPLPLQISSSWGNGTDGGTSNCLARLAIQGQSYYYAIGDEGSWPTDPNGPGGTTYINGAYPSDVQGYMIQVGGTDLNMNGVGASWASETVWPGSSGGYITILQMPDYQKLVNMTAVGGSSSYRNAPDVAMPANYVLAVSTTKSGVQNYYAVNGTSCAAPLWAGFTALVNQQAANSGKPPVGFVNPAIYEIGTGPLYNSCFHDITSGNNTNSGSPSEYYAAVGFDLCTGWGSPNGQNLINALVGFTGPVFVDFGYGGAVSDGNYYTPFKTMAQATNGVSTGGTIIFKTPGSSTETMTIKKPMTITASEGPDTVGH